MNNYFIKLIKKIIKMFNKIAFDKYPAKHK